MQSIRKQELKNLLEIVKKHPEGISIQQVLEELNFCVAKRTLQYRLSILVKSGFIKLEGLGRSSRYLFNFELEKEQSPQPGKEEEKPSGIPLSSEGHKVRQIIIKPLHLRHHVSYQRNFLDSYHPNKSYYLSKPVLDKLAQLSVKEESKLPAGTLAKKMYQKLLVDLSWNSSRLEGNTYSLQDTEKLLATGEIAQGKDPIETQMILNHKAAIEFVIDMAEEINISRYTILNIHGLLSQNLLTDPTDCGKLRTIPVKIGKSVYHPTEVPQLIEECFEIIIHKAAAIDNPFEQSFFLIVQLP